MSPEEAREELNEALNDFFFNMTMNYFFNYTLIQAAFKSKQAKDLIRKNPKNLHYELMGLYHDPSELEKVLGMSHHEFYKESFSKSLEDDTLRKRLIAMVKGAKEEIPPTSYKNKLKLMKMLNQRVYHMLEPEEQDKILAGMLAEVKEIGDERRERMLNEHLNEESQELEERNRALRQELEELERQQEEARRELLDDDIPEAEPVIPDEVIPAKVVSNSFKNSFTTPVNQNMANSRSRTRSTNLRSQGSRGNRNTP
ncbi:hypothetical protein [Abyssalbus ytuae]|uniref:Uncharacterized protein n=1 Tax=Abyssalbus ytuae TaxID=2926907 RepID=A0A9E6ZK42_9FLAO|nr:hypothetical protein [Abyssalbus ytuae]UOB17114.1 hypothetical protein MQE35_15405 [Abyssalbus ytuae]